MRKIEAKERLVLPGVSLNGGRAHARVCLYSHEHHKTVPEYLLEDIKEIEKDMVRFETALEKSRGDLEEMARTVAQTIGTAEAEIFTAQKHMMLDPALLAAIREGIRNEKRNAEHAVSLVLREYEEKFASAGNAYLKERVNDILEIRRRLLDQLRDTKPGFLCEGQQKCVRGADRIIAAHELLPSMIASIDVAKVRGFVTEHGGPSSHAAILARAIGVPAVSGVHGLMEMIQCGHQVLVDGDEGRVYIEPGPGVVERLIPLARAGAETSCSMNTPAGMQVLANINLIEELKQVENFCADGVGLFRTEFIFIRANRLMSEEEQAGYYTDVVRRMKGKPVTFRLLDVGGDKPLPFLKQEEEENPYLGLRGSRFLLENRDLFSAQVRALARATAVGPVRVLFPMVIDVRQMKVLLEAAGAALQGVRYVKENLEFGAMFEVPSAVLQAGEILNLVRFGSIGSNDLIQYLFAMDRNNEHLHEDPHHPALWAMLASLGRAAKETGRPMSICGELASLPGMAGKFLDAGILSLSVSPRLIPQVRGEMIRHAEQAMK